MLLSSGHSLDGAFIAEMVYYIWLFHLHNKDWNVTYKCMHAITYQTPFHADDIILACKNSITPKIGIFLENRNIPGK